MSYEDVKAFYERLGTDEAFRTQIQGANTKDECSQTVKSAGYNFTQEELEKYTAELLELSASQDELADLDEKELATIFGGTTMQAMYGVTPKSRTKHPPKSPPPVESISRAMYGVITPGNGKSVKKSDAIVQPVVQPGDGKIS